MTYYIIVIGCQMNKADSERLAAYLEARDYSLAADEKTADMVVLTTCGVRQSAEDRVYGLVNQIKKKNKKALVIITGCLSARSDVRRRLKAQVDIWLPIIELPELQEKISAVLANKKSPNGDNLASRTVRGTRADLTFDNIITNQKIKSSQKNNCGPAGNRTPEMQMSNLPSSPLTRPILKSYHSGPEENLKNSSRNSQEYLAINPKYSSRFTAFVPIGNGCNNFCSYCVVPYARGREVYRPAGEIIKEVKGLIKKGYKEINLIAQNVNSYYSGYDSSLGGQPKAGALNFPDLLRKINALPGDFWLRFSSSHPKDMSPDLIKAVGQCQKVCEHIHLAVQSGADEVLRAMNRKYTAAHYKKLIYGLRQAVDKRIGVPLAVTTDVIVGFPGETRKQFLNSVKLFKDIKFDLAYISRYSPRFGTASAKMKDDVSREEKKRRELVLDKVLRQTALAINKKYVGRAVAVLVFGQNSAGELYGGTRTAKSVRVKIGAADKNEAKKLIGQFIRVKINKVQDFGLEGEIIYEKNKNGVGRNKKTK